MVLGTASFTLGGADRVAFAVYSADNDSLNFYKRMDIPEAGDTFEDKTVTAVYTGFETDVYGLSIEDNWNGPYTTPWYEYKDNIRSVKIIDDGIEPANTRFWFGNLSNVESIDLSKIRTPKDQSDCYLDLFVNCKKLKHIDLGALASVSPIRMDSAFAGCSSLKSVDLSRLDTSDTKNFAYLFQNCTSLEEIKGSDILVNAGTNRIECMFQHCKSLSSLDLSGWIVNSKMIYCLATFYGCNVLSEVKVGRGFCVPVDQHGNYAVLPVPSSDSIPGADGKWYSVTTGQGYAPADIPAGMADTYVASKELLPKVAFAVYSADDGSLDFYKRLLCDVPVAGSTFEGKTVTDVYTGVETDAYTGKWVDYRTDCPWSPHSFDVKSVRVVDAIRPRSISWWFTKFYNCTSFDDLDLIDTRECTSFQRAFSHCNQVTELQGLGNWDTGNVTDISCIFDGCTQLSSIPGIDGWNVSKVEDCSQAFYCCQNLAHLDLSKWIMSPKETGQGVFAYCYLLEELDLSGFDFRRVPNEWTLFKNDYSLKKVTFGPNWKWVDTDGFLSAPSAEHIPGADGKWYSTTTGIGYTPADIPSWKADTYVASKELLPKVAFAVYSADDGSLDFYKRAFCDVPATGDAFDGKAVTSAYTGFEEGTYTGTWPNDDCPWFSIATKVKSVTVVDAIRPKSMAWWFNGFCNCKSFDLGHIDTRECVSFRRLFSACTSCISITGLDRWNMGSATDLSATFDGLVKLKTIPGISGWDTGNVKYFAETFYNLNSLEQLDLSNWDDSSLIPGVAIDGIGYSGDIVGTSDGTMKSFKSFTVGSKWSNTVYLARRINLASSGTIPTDGKWYSASDGAAYAPTDIPVRKAGTYYASAILSAAAKDAKDWTLAEQEAVADGIAANGDASPAYAKAKAAMNSGTTWSIALTNGETMTYRIIGIDHDDLTDGSGKAGLTFLTISHGIYSRMNSTNSNAGGWKKSELRAKMNSGEIWNLMPSEFRDKVKAVTKLTNNIGGNDENCTVTTTSDKLSLLSYSEIVETPYSGWSGYNWIGKEGSQYELFHNTVLENFSNNSIIAIGESWWERSTTPSYSTRFCNVNGEGDPSGNYDSTQSFCVLPVFCF